MHQLWDDIDILCITIISFVRQPRAEALHDLFHRRRQHHSGAELIHLWGVWSTMEARQTKAQRRVVGLQHTKTLASQWFVLNLTFAGASTCDEGLVVCSCGTPRTQAGFGDNKTDVSK